MSWFSALWANSVSKLKLASLDRVKILRKAFGRLINLIKIIEHKAKSMLNMLNYLYHCCFQLQCVLLLATARANQARAWGSPCPGIVVSAYFKFHNAFFYSHPLGGVKGALSLQPQQRAARTSGLHLLVPVKPIGTATT